MVVKNGPVGWNGIKEQLEKLIKCLQLRVYFLPDEELIEHMLGFITPAKDAIWLMTTGDLSDIRPNSEPSCQNVERNLTAIRGSRLEELTEQAM